MANNISDTDAQAPRQLQLKLENASVLPKVLPKISLGEILKVIVRQNPPDGPGLIAFRGLLVRASLPPDVQVGDKLNARISESDGQIVLKILERDAAPQTAPVQEPVIQLIADLEELVKTSDLQGVKTLNAVQISKALQEVSTIESRFQKFLSVVASADTLADSKEALKQLIGSSNGSLVQSLREAAKAIRSFVEQYSMPPSERPIALIREELTKLLLSAAQNNTVATKSLDQLINAMQLELQDKKKPAAAEKEVLRSALADVRNARNANVNATVDETRNQLQTALLRLAVLEQSEQRTEMRLDPKTSAELQQLAQRLDQFAGAQETINKLNPVMQAMGEPALVLFPFLFQGLLSHTEVTVETREVKNNKEEKNRKKGGEAKNEPFQRVQINVPLPSMGPVDADIAHRNSEILVRLTSEDPEVGRFLTEQLENLAATLREQGFERAELVANVGLRPGSSASWSFDLHAATSLFA